MRGEFAGGPSSTSHPLGMSIERRVDAGADKIWRNGVISARTGGLKLKPNKPSITRLGLEDSSLWTIIVEVHIR